MKKIILLALAAMMMAGCDKIRNEIKKVDKARQTANTVQIVIIDSCEYISKGTKELVEHKGNCRFCKERRQKELEELVKQLKEK